MAGVKSSLGPFPCMVFISNRDSDLRKQSPVQEWFRERRDSTKAQWYAISEFPSDSKASALWRRLAISLKPWPADTPAKSRSGWAKFAPQGDTNEIMIGRQVSHRFHLNGGGDVLRDGYIQDVRSRAGKKFRLLGATAVEMATKL